MTHEKTQELLSMEAQNHKYFKQVIKQYKLGHVSYKDSIDIFDKWTNYASNLIDSNYMFDFITSHERDQWLQRQHDLYEIVVDMLES